MTGESDTTSPDKLLEKSVRDEGMLPDEQAGFSDEELLELARACKRESFEGRWVFERQWLRNIYYMLNRQWIYYNSRLGEWQDRRLAKWIPRPVTNKCKEGVQAIRAMFADIKIGVIVRPNGQDPKNVVTASVCDELHPLLHEEHMMSEVLSEAHFWFIVLGNAFLHTFWEYNPKYGTVEIAYEQCQSCGTVTPSTELTGPTPVCPKCGGNQFQTAVNPATGMPMIETRSMGRGVTLPLSPLEIAYPYHYPRFSEVPYVIRLRWRTKSYFENSAALASQVKDFNWQKSPQDRSLQIFRSLPLQNDLGVAPMAWNVGGGSEPNDEGAPEYELWHKPTDKYPKGLVVRWIGDRDERIIHLENEEGLPGPIPYTDVEGNSLFPFAHAAYEYVGGRSLGSGALDPVIQKQDQINQLDSMFQMIIQRVANPVWLEPKGADVEKFTGEPGLVVRWNPLTVGGNAKPERISGEGPHSSLFTIREMYLKDFEDLMGTFDIIKGAKPTGVEAFSALQLLVERSQSRFSSAFRSLGDFYRSWFSFAIELERQFGPENRTKAILTPAKGYAYKTFKNAQLQGSVTIVVEDGSTSPKTNLGLRAAMEHANQLGMLNMQDPDTQYEGLKLMGLTRMVPSLDIHVNAALQKQEAFEKWANNDAAIQQSIMMAKQEQMQFQQQMAAMPPIADGQQGAESMLPTPPSPLNHTPLKWLRWYDPTVHRQEFLKWANGDTIRDLLAKKSQLEGLLDAHLQEIEMAGAQTTMQQAMASGGLPGGAGAGMSNSNRESTQGNEPKGNGQGAQKQGPA